MILLDVVVIAAVVIIYVLEWELHLFLLNSMLFFLILYIGQHMILAKQVLALYSLIFSYLLSWAYRFVSGRLIIVVYPHIVYLTAQKVLDSFRIFGV